MAEKSVCQSCGGSDFAQMKDGIHELCLNCGTRHVMDVKPSVPGIQINVGGNVTGNMNVFQRDGRIYGDQVMGNKDSGQANKKAMQCPECHKLFRVPRDMENLVVRRSFEPNARFKGSLQEAWGCPHCQRRLKFNDILVETEVSIDGRSTVVGNITGSSGIAIGHGARSQNGDIVIEGSNDIPDAIPPE